MHYSCDHCHYSTTRQFNLKRHYQNKHHSIVAPRASVSVDPHRAPTTISVPQAPQSLPQPYPAPTNAYPSHTTNTAGQVGYGVPQTVSYDLFERYRNALVNTIRVKENLRNENIELVRHRDDTLDKMSQDFASLYHRYKDSRKEIKELLKC